MATRIINRPSIKIEVKDGKYKPFIFDNGKKRYLNSSDEPEPPTPPVPPEPTNRILYTVVEGGTQPTSAWITKNCSDNVFDAETGEGYLVLNEGVTTLDGEYIEEPEEIIYTIFKDCTNEDSEDNNITSVVIPSQITSIGYFAFSECERLTSITISNSVTSIGESTFYGCRGLTSITIPDSITTIGNYAFASCIGLTSITIPNSVTSIGNNAFDSCLGLTSIIIPNSVTTISYGVFLSCTGLTSITIPNSVTSIGQSAFSNCSGLTSVTIPNSVTSIGTRAFNLCTSLASVKCLATTPPNLGTVPFSNLATTTCGVPEASILAYEENKDWLAVFSTFVAADV